MELEARKAVLYSIFDAGVRAVAPDAALMRHVCLEGDSLLVDGKRWPLPRRGRLLVLGAGKGVAPMGAAVEELLGDRIHSGLLVVKYGHGLPLRQITQVEAAHPVPDAAGAAATQALLELAAGTTADDLVLCLLTGGASALTPAPVPGVTLEDMQQVTELLLRSGATIAELNAVRKHLSRFSGGQLARTAAPAGVVSVIVSDVVGDALDVIASGPTAPDASTFADCMDILARYELAPAMPPAVLDHLQKGCLRQDAETPKPGDALFRHVQNTLVATNRQALDAAADVSVLLTWWQLRDGVEDHAWASGLKYRAGARLLESAYKRAAALRPEFDQAVRRQLQLLSALEQAKDPSMDRAADSFAVLLSSAAEELTDPIRKRIMEQLLYHLGRWIYLIDGADDLKKDAESGNYNPVALRYGLTDGTWTPESRRDFATTLDHSIHQMAAAFELWDFGVWTPVLQSTFYGGLFQVGKAVLDGSFHRPSRKKIREIEETE